MIDAKSQINHVGMGAIARPAEEKSAAKGWQIPQPKPKTPPPPQSPSPDHNPLALSNSSGVFTFRNISAEKPARANSSSPSTQVSTFANSRSILFSPSRND